MTFRRLTLKLLRKNKQQFAFCFFSNIFVIFILFITSNLLFNENIYGRIGIRAVQPTIVLATTAIILFSIIFLCFIWINFTKSRLKEFETYVSLGLSAKNLQNLTHTESSLVFAWATAIGGFASLLFMPLFYLILAKMLNVSINLLYISYNTFLLSLGMIAIIFAVQQWITGFIIKNIVIGKRNKPFMGSLIAAIIRLFPQKYRRGILWLSMSKFFDYWMTMICVAFVICASLILIGYGFITFSHEAEVLDFLPYHFTIDSRGGINNVGHEQLNEIVNSAGASISTIRTLSYLDATPFRFSEPPLGMFRHFEQKSFLVSVTAFNKFTGQQFSVDENELLIITNDRDAYAAGVYFETSLRPDWDAPALNFTIPETTIKFMPFANTAGEMTFEFQHANVINDAVWINLAQNHMYKINELTVFNIHTGNHTDIMNRLILELSALNNLPTGTWDNAAEFSLIRRDDPRQLRPISQAERQGVVHVANGLLLFVSIFLSLFFLISSCIMLFYKFLLKTSEEKDKLIRLKNIGFTAKECHWYLISHVTVLFFLPLIFGGIIGIVGSYLLFNVVVVVSGILGAVLVVGVVLYFILLRKIKMMY